jgi:hypothetical protein
MKRAVLKSLVPFGVLVPVLLCSCASEPVPLPAYTSADPSALIVESLDNHYAQIVAPTPMNKVESAAALEQLKKLPRRRTAIIILENYSEPTLGSEFRDRSMGWFIGLRGLGYEHIFFLKGKGVADPTGLLTLAEYD